ncbi:MAG: SpoIIE family protein phosphatase, partial [Acidobacteriaceae bacterium]|nr:SpoIIE family protein phosphatase [Acidobacteriaceae bacterium]
IVEANVKDGKEFGAERLQLFLRESNTLAPAQIIDQLFQKISNGDQQDDLTAVLAEFQ